MNNKETICPVCGYDLGFKAWEGESPSDEICPSCGIQFGYDDFSTIKEEIKIRHSQFRQKWIESGMKWWSQSRPQPENWNPKKQLENILSIENNGRSD